MVPSLIIDIFLYMLFVYGFFGPTIISLIHDGRYTWLEAHWAIHITTLLKEQGRVAQYINFAKTN